MRTYRSNFVVLTRIMYDNEAMRRSTWDALAAKVQADAAKEGLHVLSTSYTPYVAFFRKDPDHDLLVFCEREQATFVRLTAEIMVEEGVNNASHG